MKKVLITLTMLLALGTAVPAAAQKHRHTPQQELVDTTSKDAVEVYSDTTSAAQATSDVDDWTDEQDEAFDSSVTSIFTSMDAKDMGGMLFVLSILFLLFVLAPVAIIIALFYFINKNRRDRMRLAQMAMQQGQPIPERLLEEQAGGADEEYQKGLRQFFVGAGLMIFLGFAAGEIGFGIGALVACIGLGKIAASKIGNKKKADDTSLNAHP